MCGVVALVVDGDQARVLQSCDRSGLPMEPGQELLVAGIPGVHHLQRHRAVQTHVEPAVDRGHPTGGNRILHAVPTVEQGADERVRRHRHILSVVAAGSAVLHWAP